MSLPQPLLNLLGPLPLTGLQPRQQFRARRALHLGHGPTTVLALEQSRYAASFKGAHPVEKPPLTHAQLLGYLRTGKLPAGSQSRGQQPLLTLHLLTGPQRNRHVRR